MAVPQWNAEIITPDSDASAEIIDNGGLVKDENGAVGVSVDGDTIVINSDGELQANIPTPDTVDQVFDPVSTHAQSGTAVAGALPVFGTTIL